MRVDPVDMLFGVQLGGGTDINKSVGYCEQFIKEPQSHVVHPDHRPVRGRQSGPVGPATGRHGRVRRAGRSVCSPFPTAASPATTRTWPESSPALGIPCFGCTPQKLPELLEGALRGANLKTLADQVAHKQE